MSGSSGFDDNNIKKKAKPRHIAWVGDGNNVLHDLMLAAAMTGYDLVYATPDGMGPDSLVLERALSLSKKNGSSITGTSDPKIAVKDAGVIYTDVFISMGEEHIEGNQSSLTVFK